MPTLADEGSETQTGARTARSRVDDVIALGLAGSIAASVMVFALTRSQPVLEWFGFRQAQTALTAYWFVRDGFALAYQTPVLGYPWPIPLELPLFQALVAAIASVSNYPLDDIGRGLSFAFFLATLAPVGVICKRLQLGSRVFFVFASLYLLSPQYLFWGRTFMIESIATFFTVATLAAALPLLEKRAVSSVRLVTIVVLGSLALTVKVTTGLPALAVFAACLVVQAFRPWRQGDAGLALRYVLRAGLFLLPVIVSVAWTEFTDAVKAQNEAGKLLVSGALTRWTFGWFLQRLHPYFYLEVIWNRCIAANIGGILGLAAIVFFFRLEKRRERVLVGVCLAILFLLPLYAFTNLHIIHNYYQSANIVYLLFLAALALGFLSEYGSGRLFMLVYALVLVSNVLYFQKEGWAVARRSFTAENNRVLAIAKVLKEQSAPDKPILIYGLEWSSELPYYAERKAMAVPDVYPRFEEPLRAPVRYLGTTDIGALVICPGKQRPGDDAVAIFVQTAGPFNETMTYGCKVFVKAG
jgi:hypothetical protein